MKIGIISDTHSYLDDRILHQLKDCEQVWHAGDFGSVEVSDTLSAQNKLIGVYGNIDGKELRAIHPLEQTWEVGGLLVYMTHIAGYPGTYKAKARKAIDELQPDIVVTGHSHITKVVRDPKHGHFHINPGAAGLHGFHKMRTLILMGIEQGKLSEMKVVELGVRGKV